MGCCVICWLFHNFISFVHFWFVLCYVHNKNHMSKREFFCVEFCLWGLIFSDKFCVLFYTFRCGEVVCTVFFYSFCFLAAIAHWVCALYFCFDVLFWAFLSNRIRLKNHLLIFLWVLVPSSKVNKFWLLLLMKWKLSRLQKQARLTSWERKVMRLRCETW